MGHEYVNGTLYLCEATSFMGMVYASSLAIICIALLAGAVHLVCVMVDFVQKVRNGNLHPPPKEETKSEEAHSTYRSTTTKETLRAELQRLADDNARLRSLLFNANENRGL